MANRIEPKSIPSEAAEAAHSCAVKHGISRDTLFEDLKDATPFRTEREAQAIEGQVQDASGVTKGMDGFFYVMR